MMVLINAIYQLRHEVMIPDLILSGLAVVVLTYFIRNQTFVDDTEYMRGMIPHHSMALLMSEKIKEKSTNQSVLKLADRVIQTEEAEIEYIKSLGY